MVQARVVCARAEEVRGVEARTAKPSLHGEEQSREQPARKHRHRPRACRTYEERAEAMVPPLRRGAEHVLRCRDSFPVALQFRGHLSQSIARHQDIIDHPEKRDGIRNQINR